MSHKNPPPMFGLRLYDRNREYLRNLFSPGAHIGVIHYTNVEDVRRRWPPGVSYEGANIGLMDILDAPVVARETLWEMTQHNEAARP